MEINTINLVGRAGREPDVRYFESGSIVANFTLAVNRRSRDEEPDWFNLEIWGKQAQIAADYVKKGSLIGITGSFKIDSWKDKNTGEDRYKPVVRVDRLNLLSSRKESGYFQTLFWNLVSLIYLLLQQVCIYLPQYFYLSNFQF